jgi:hypothetical protein
LRWVNGSIGIGKDIAGIQWLSIGGRIISLNKKRLPLVE